MSKVQLEFELCPFCGKNPVCDDKLGLCGCVEEDHFIDFEVYQDDERGFSCAMVCKNCKACGPVSGVFKEKDDSSGDAIIKWNTRRFFN
jgi:hypothetical protein